MYLVKDLPGFSRREKPGESSWWLNLFTFAGKAYTACSKYLSLFRQSSQDNHAEEEDDDNINFDDSDVADVNDDMDVDTSDDDSDTEKGCESQLDGSAISEDNEGSEDSEALVEYKCASIHHFSDSESSSDEA